MQMPRGDKPVRMPPDDRPGGAPERPTPPAPREHPGEQRQLPADDEEMPADDRPAPPPAHDTQTSTTTLTRAIRASRR